MDIGTIGIEYFNDLHLGVGLFAWAVILLTIVLMIRATACTKNQVVPIKVVDR